MNKTLQQAISELSRLPEAEQECIGRMLIRHVRLRRDLRAKIGKGWQSLDDGRGSIFDIEQLIRRKNQGRA
ncbi:MULTISPECIES: hypothetical protein [unclassified Bradyrhizobium]|uniref:hypothetical protein n=1 Tax=unclassified Bradyrhizobium TaxID=2631580 RepID=UPI0024E04DFF|nr:MULTISPECIES: hypothetical protein [unclassified Bradyrhizobium]